MLQRARYRDSAIHGISSLRCFIFGKLFVHHALVVRTYKISYERFLDGRKVSHGKLALIQLAIQDFLFEDAINSGF
jgi:hypothetical protein